MFYFDFCHSAICKFFLEGNVGDAVLLCRTCRFATWKGKAPAQRPETPWDPEAVEIRIDRAKAQVVSWLPEEAKIKGYINYIRADKETAILGRLGRPSSLGAFSIESTTRPYNPILSVCMHRF